MSAVSTRSYSHVDTDIGAAQEVLVVGLCFQHFSFELFELAARIITRQWEEAAQSSTARKRPVAHRNLSPKRKHPPTMQDKTPMTQPILLVCIYRLLLATRSNSSFFLIA